MCKKKTQKAKATRRVSSGCLATSSRRTTRDARGLNRLVRLRAKLQIFLFFSPQHLHSGQKPRAARGRGTRWVWSGLSFDPPPSLPPSYLVHRHIFQASCSQPRISVSKGPMHENPDDITVTSLFCVTIESPFSAAEDIMQLSSRG